MIRNFISGMPYIADIQSAAFYPLNIFFYFLQVEKAIVFFTAFHFFLLMLFVYVYVRNLNLSFFASIVSSIVFAYSGFFVVHIRHPVFLSSGVWLPLALFFLDKIFIKSSFFYTICLGITLALSLLGGSIQISYFVFLVTAIYFIFRYFEFIKKEISIFKKVAFFWLLPFGIIFSFLFSAIQVLPTLELFGFSYRSEITSSYEFASSFALGVPELIRFFVPNFYGNDLTGNVIVGSGNYWEMHCYVGLLSFFLSIIKIGYKRDKTTLFFAFLAIFSLLVAFGKLLPFHYLVYKFFPFYKVFRAPARFVFIYTFSIAILSGYGASFLEEILLKKLPVPKFFFITMIILSVFLFILVSATVLFFKKVLLSNLTNNPLFFKSITLFFINLILVVLLFCLLKFNKIALREFCVLTLFILCFDYLTLWDGYNRSVSLNKAKLPDDIVSFLSKNDFYRVLPDETVSSIVSNWAMKVGYYSIRGYNPSNIKHYWEYLMANEGGEI